MTVREEQLIQRAKLEQELVANQQAFECRMMQAHDVIIETDKNGRLI